MVFNWLDQNQILILQVDMFRSIILFNNMKLLQLQNLEIISFIDDLMDLIDSTGHQHHERTWLKAILKNGNSEFI